MYGIRIVIGNVTAIAAIMVRFLICSFVVRHNSTKEIVRLLRICSNNLNQYARRANESGYIHYEDIRDLKNRLEKLWELAAGTMEALAAIR